MRLEFQYSRMPITSSIECAQALVLTYVFHCLIYVDLVCLRNYPHLLTRVPREPDYMPSHIPYIWGGQWESGRCF